MAAEPIGDGEVILAEPARQQLLDLAADVLGRLGSDDVPGPLRAIARFTPAKRRRLGATALAAALDGDPAFRSRVADAVVAASPELVAAIRDGTPTTASDPVDVAIVAYLVRPDGWRETVTAAGESWAVQKEARSASSSELEQLRDEAAQLRAAARGEAGRIRDAVAAAAEDAEAELVALRRTVRDRTRDLRAAERARDDAEALAQQARDDLERGQADHETELRRLRGRVAEADRGAEAARRAARTEREVDDARLWLLIDTLVQAAGGVRRELSLPSPAIRPADAFESAGSAAGGRTVSDSDGLDRVLALPNVHLVVDGYNVTKTGYPELPLADQRTRLIGTMATLAAQSGAEITIAFDGSTRPPVQPATPRGVRVLFSAADEIADDLIRRLVAAEPEGRPVLVVTSDRQIVSDTARGGVWAAPSAVLLARLG